VTAPDVDATLRVARAHRVGKSGEPPWGGPAAARKGERFAFADENDGGD